VRQADGLGEKALDFGQWANDGSVRVFGGVEVAHFE